MTNNSKQYTNEVRRKFLNQVWQKIDSWAENDESTEREKLEGLAFSIMAMLDGCVPGLPQWQLVPYEPEEGEDYLATEREAGSIAGGLHEMFYSARLVEMAVRDRENGAERADIPF